MAIFLTVLIVFVSVISGLGSPTREDDISAAVSAGRWDLVQRILQEHAKETFTWSPFLSADVKDLRPINGGQVYGESEFTFHSSSNINGRNNEESGGHKVVNDNGEVVEYDFKP